MSDVMILIKSVYVRRDGKGSTVIKVCSPMSYVVYLRGLISIAPCERDHYGIDNI